MCGKWLIGEDLFQGTIENSSGINVDQDSCLSRCHDTPECNAVVFKPGSKQCWVKNSPPGTPIPSQSLSSVPLLFTGEVGVQKRKLLSCGADDVPLLDTHSESYALCEGEQPGQGGQGSSRGVGGEQSGARETLNKLRYYVHSCSWPCLFVAVYAPSYAAVSSALGAWVLCSVDACMFLHPLYRMLVMQV